MWMLEGEGVGGREVAMGVFGVFGVGDIEERVF